MVTVSVLITTYNAERTISQTLDSVFAQEGSGEYFNLEVIAVDDCSTDGTLDILNSYPIRVLSTEKNSGGPNRGRNIALKTCSGSYICFMDHDDLWMPNKLILQLEAAQYAPVVTCGFVKQIVATSRRFTSVNRPSFKGSYVVYPENATFRKKLARRMDGQVTYLGTIFISSELAHHRFEEHYGQIDYDWILRIFEDQKSIEVAEPLLVRYIYGSNLSLNEDYRQRDFKFSMDFLDRYENKFPDEVSYGRKKLYGTLARYYYTIGKMPEARKYFYKSPVNWVTVLFLITSFFGHSIVRRYVNFFGS